MIDRGPGYLQSRPKIGRCGFIEHYIYCTVLYCIVLVVVTAVRLCVFVREEDSTILLRGENINIFSLFHKYP